LSIVLNCQELTQALETLEPSDVGRFRFCDTC
jgi:hypothetical protein